MAWGLPVIITKEVDIAEHVEAGDAGFVVEATVEDVATRMSRVLEAPDEARAMGDRAGDQAAAVFSWDAIAVRLEAMYDEAVAHS
jgi:glycosyltransferase involved in cell wall biosynthesis